MSITARRKTIRGVTLADDPAREACFTIGHTDAEMATWFDAGMSPISRRERLHRHMNNEVGSLEIAAQSLADFPEADWELRMCLARQAYDESRHVAALYCRLKKLGGYKGEFPVANFEWCVSILFDTLAVRLAIQNRTFEAGQMDLLGTLRDKWREAGDEATAEMLEQILVDEISHVRFANRWIRRLVERDRRLVLKIAVAVRLLGEINAGLAVRPGEVNIVGQDLEPTQNHVSISANVEDRRYAEFSDDEIREILRQQT